MGYYGHNKTRQMVRSILPSTARKVARERKRALHHKNRAEISEKLAHYRGPASEVVERYENESKDLELCWTPRFMNNWDHIVYDRRAADKLNHFERWAREITKDLPADERFEFMEALVPPGMIGDHALSHLNFLKADYKNYYEQYLARKREARLRWRDFRNEVYETLREIARDDRKRKKFNAAAVRHGEEMWRSSHHYSQWIPDTGCYIWVTPPVPKGWILQIHGYHGVNKFWREIAPTYKHSTGPWWHFVLNYLDMEYK